MVQTNEHQNEPASRSRITILLQWWGTRSPSHFPSENLRLVFPTKSPLMTTSPPRVWSLPRPRSPSRPRPPPSSLSKSLWGAVTSSSSCFVSSASLRKPQQRRGIFPFFRAFCQSSSLIVLCSNTFCELSLNLSHMLYNHFLLKTCGHQFFNHIALFLIRIKNIFINCNLCLSSLFHCWLETKWFSQGPSPYQLKEYRWTWTTSCACYV